MHAEMPVVFPVKLVTDLKGPTVGAYSLPCEKSLLVDSEKPLIICMIQCCMCVLGIINSITVTLADVTVVMNTVQHCWFFAVSVYH